MSVEPQDNNQIDNLTGINGFFLLLKRIVSRRIFSMLGING